MDDAPLENIRTFRATLNVIGDGFIEAIGNDTFDEIRSRQPAGFQGTIIRVPVLEDGGTLRVGRFGWKNQHASLESFSGDAYFNEMGITNPLRREWRKEREHLSGRVGRKVRPGTRPGGRRRGCGSLRQFHEGHQRSRSRADQRAGSPRGGSVCASSLLFCHTPSITTVQPGTLINGGQFRVPSELGNKVIHPFSDFMLHDIGTGDGIVQNGGQATRNMVRTPPLWGLRTHPMLMHDGQSFTFSEAIQRHAGAGGTHSRNFFNKLSNSHKADLIAFLKSL